MFKDFLINLVFLTKLELNTLLPFIIMGLVIILLFILNRNQKIYNKSYFLYILINLPGTFFHELMHYIVGLITLAKPTNFSIIPKRKDGYITFGFVSFTNLKWYNSFPTGMAPLTLVLLIPYIFNLYFEKIVKFNGDLNAYIYSIILGYVLYSIAISFKPSSPDIKIAFSSYIGLAFYTLLIYFFIENNLFLSFM